MNDALAMPPHDTPDDRRDDADLVAAAHDDPAAFGTLYERYRDRIS
jgi:hypothetical protein